MNQIKRENYKDLYVVLGVVNDKDLDSILPLFPKKAKYFFCKPNLDRGLDASILQQKAQAFGLNGEVCDSVSVAFEKAKAEATLEDFIYIGGSTFVVAEIV